MSSSTIHAGSNLTDDVVTLEPVSGPGGKSAGKGASEPAFAGNSFTTTYQWRGNGTVRLNLQNSLVNAGSRVVASISEYNTAWNVDRFVGNATMQVLNVSPYNGGVAVRISDGWNSPLNHSITLMVEP